MELISAEIVFRAMGPNDITWGVNMRFMKCLVLEIVSCIKDWEPLLWTIIIMHSQFGEDNEKDGI